MIFKGLNKFIAEIDHQRMDVRYNHGLDIRVNKVFGNPKFFTEDIQGPVTADEPDEDDVALRDMADLGQLCVGPRFDRFIARLLDHLTGGFPLEATVTVMLVVKPLKMLALSLQGLITCEPLSAKELAVIGVVKVFNHPVSPGLPNRNKNRLDAVVKT